MKSSQVKFNANALRRVLMKNLSQEQTNRLIEYAKQEIIKIGDMIQTYNSRNHMDRTGNLLNSLCWGVCYNGKMEAKGFYRPAVIHDLGGNKSSASRLHEFFLQSFEEINGRALAEDFLSKQEKSGGQGWRVFFAILAPYWGYWESGFTIRKRLGGGGTRFMRFQVMSHFFDEVRMDLTPAETHLTVFVPKYMYKNRKYRKKYKKHVGIRDWSKQLEW